MVGYVFEVEGLGDERGDEEADALLLAAPSLPLMRQWCVLLNAVAGCGGLRAAALNAVAEREGHVAEQQTVRGCADENVAKPDAVGNDQQHDCETDDELLRAAFAGDDPHDFVATAREDEMWGVLLVAKSWTWVDKEKEKGVSRRLQRKGHDWRLREVRVCGTRVEISTTSALSR